MPDATTFDSFEKELNRLVESFGKRITATDQSNSNNTVTAQLIDLLSFIPFE